MEKLDDMAGADSRPAVSGELAGDVSDLAQGLQADKPKGPKPKGKGKKVKVKKEKKPKAPRAHGRSFGDMLDDLRRSPVPVIAGIILGGLLGFWVGRPELAGEIIFGAVGAAIGGAIGWIIHG